MHREILEDLSKDCPCMRNGCGTQWCFFRELIESIGLSDRQIEQIRLIYDYKYITSKKEGKDIGKERAVKEFVEKYASRFDEVYQEGMKNEELFGKVFGFKKYHTDEEIREHLDN